MEQVKVVLFCGGHGRRMRTNPHDPPKPLVQIGGRPLLWHVMRYYAHFGLNSFVLCLGYGAHAIKEFFLRYEESQSNDFRLRPGRAAAPHTFDVTEWDITFVDTGLNASVGERLMRVREHVEGDPMFLANYADTLTDADLGVAIEKFRRDSAVASLLAVPPNVTHHAVQMSDSGLVTAVRPIPEVVPWENGGYFLFRPDVFEVLRSGEDLVPHALDRLIHSQSLSARRHSGFWRAVDTPKDRDDLEDMYGRDDCPWMLWDPMRCRSEADSTAVQRPPNLGLIGPNDPLPNGADGRTGPTRDLMITTRSRL